MLPRNRKDSLSAIVLCALLVIAGCTIEVNINTTDEEPGSPIVTVAPTAPTASEPTVEAEAPVEPAEPDPSLRPRSAERRLPIPPPPPAPVAEPGYGVIRDALFRYREEVTQPPPPASEDLSREPTFTPFTVAPSILNRMQVVEAMQREYPPLLREAGVGGTVRMYFFIDAQGHVLRALLDSSSGHEALDEAALRVADVYRFSAALNRDERIPVWVSFPITFQTR